MRVNVAILVNLLTLVWAAFGDEQLPVLKVGDTTYTNVSVLRVTATDICFSSASGIGSAKLTDLDPAVQAQFAPEAAKAAAVEKTQAEAAAEYLRAVALQSPPLPASDAQGGDSASGADSSSTNKPIAKTFLNLPGPDLVAEKWLSASPNTKDKLVLIDFWATTNEPSQSFISKLNGFQDRFTTNLAIIGISHEGEDDVRKIVDPAIQYSSAIDTQGQMESAIALKKLPYVLLLDTNWVVRWEGNPLNSTNALTEAVISSLLEKFPPAPPPPAE
jgi:cytochrome c biogenesis protein CcmG, thiol:disulfide interchange protein DsbE